MKSKEYVYKYEHVNGNIITKPRLVVEGSGGGPRLYFDSPFVKRWWVEDLDEDVETKK